MGKLLRENYYGGHGVKLPHPSPRLGLRKGVVYYAANLQENTNAEVRFQESCFANFIEIALRHGCSPANLLHNITTPFLKNASGRLLLNNSPFPYVLADNIYGLLKDLSVGEEINNACSFSLA